MLGVSDVVAPHLGCSKIFAQAQTAWARSVHSRKSHSAVIVRRIKLNDNNLSQKCFNLKETG